MTPEEFEAKTQELIRRKAEDYDFGLPELHKAMDDLMCEALADLGYGAGVKVFENAKKWYA